MCDKCVTEFLEDGGVQIRAGGTSIKQLRSESVVNYPVLIQQIEIPITFHVHAPHRLLAYY
jgi:hypothetical protein